MQRFRYFLAFITVGWIVIIMSFFTKIWIRIQEDFADLGLKIAGVKVVTVEDMMKQLEGSQEWTQFKEGMEKEIEAFNECYEEAVQLYEARKKVEDERKESQDTTEVG